MADLHCSGSIVVAASPDVVWAVVTDVTRTGEWSPICRAGWWESDDRGVGAWFGGRNVTEQRTWETRSQVVVADPGREFAWRVGSVGAWGARWGYRLEPVDGGTRLTEEWRFLPTGHAVFRARYGARAATEIAERADAARRGIPQTLAALKRVIEAG